MSTRYYNPEVGRFLNADVTVSTGQRFVGCNMYAYCINNPINYHDLEGTDAVWIQERDSAGTFGHTGLLVENGDGSWYFFYWGMDSEAIDFGNIMNSIKGTEAKLVWKELETGNFDLTTTDGVISALQNSNDKSIDRSALVTDTLYFPGDFSKTFHYIEGLTQTTQQYNLLFNNCVQQSTKALQCSNLAFEQASAVIPNVAFRKAKLIYCLRNVLERIFS